MSAISAGSKIGQRPCPGLNSAYFGNQFFLKVSSHINRKNRAKFYNHVFCANFSKFLFTKPVSITAVKRVRAPFVFGKPDIKRDSVGIFPNVDIHGVLLIDGHLDSVPCR